ncbi:MAG: carboxymuconolactone decarboxylase family protein [Bacteroidota bacterium]
MKNRLNPVNPEEAFGKTDELYRGIHTKLGMVPNMMRTMGNSPAVLEGYLNFSQALGKGLLGGKLGEMIALTVAQANSCDYCLSAHSLIGEKMAGVSPEALYEARNGEHSDPKIQAVLQFALALVEKKGQVTDEDVDRVIQAGYTQGEVAEIVAHVGLNIFTNYFNNTANTTIDFPEVSASDMIAVV